MLLMHNNIYTDVKDYLTPNTLVYSSGGNVAYERSNCLVLYNSCALEQVKLL